MILCGEREQTTVTETCLVRKRTIEQEECQQYYYNYYYYYYNYILKQLSLEKRELLGLAEQHLLEKLAAHRGWRTQAMARGAERTADRRGGALEQEARVIGVEVAREALDARR